MIDAKKIVEEYMDAICRHDLTKARHLMHEDYSYTSGDGHKKNGIDAGIGVAQMFGEAFPDMKFEIKNMYLSGNIVITEFDFTGTHKGKLMNMDPTHRTVRVPTCNLTEIREGKIYAEREYLDRAYMMQQLGVETRQEHPV